MFQTEFRSYPEWCMRTFLWVYANRSPYDSQQVVRNVATGVCWDDHA